MNLSQIRIALENPDAEVRRLAVIAIGDSREAHLGPCLLTALGDEEWRVRKEAVRVASERAVKLGIMSGLVDAICQGTNVGLRNAALDVLASLGSQAADVLLEALPRVPEGTKRFVIEAMVCGGDERVVRTLIDVTEGDDIMIAAAAMDALAEIGGTEAEKALHKQLSSKDSFHRTAALDALNRLQVVLPFDDLVNLLMDPLVRRVALQAMGRCMDIRAVSPLLQALSDKSTTMVSTSVLALAQLMDGSSEIIGEVNKEIACLNSEVANNLRPLLSRGSLKVRQNVSQILCMMRDLTSLEGVVALAASGSLPSMTLEQLYSWGEAAVQKLIEIYHSAYNVPAAAALELAYDVASHLSDIDPDFHAQLHRILSDALLTKDPDVVVAAANCMRDFSSSEDARTLVKVAEQGDDVVAHYCGRALMALASRDGQAVREALQDVVLDGPAGAPFTMLVATVGGDDRFHRLQAALSAQDKGTRKAAISGLAELGGPNVAELISFSLADESEDVQMAAARALGRLRDEVGRPIGAKSLLLALRSDSLGVQAAAARALGETGEKHAIEPLRDLVWSGVPGVAVAAIEGLRVLGDPSLDDLLLELLGHEDEEVVKQALKAISEAGGSRALPRISIGLEHAAWDVRQLAANLLGIIADKAALSALTSRLEVERDELVIEAIKQAISKLGEEA